MAKASRRNSKKRPDNNPGARKPRIPARIKAYSGSGFHTPGKYGTKERRATRLEIERERN